MLASWGDVVSEGCAGVLVAKDLKSLLVELRIDGCGCTAYLQEARHGLQTANGTKVNAILEGTHGDEGTSEEAFPVLQETRAC